jgi:hypothetical protein
MPAEVIFNAQSVYEGRIHTEFFKHLPGLLTGLGIIGTFMGLIQGLGSATAAGTALDTALLISSVRDAFYASATAITLTMLITYIEKFLVASLHRAVEQLCQQIDGNCSPLALAGSLGREHRAAGKAGADGGESA